MMNDFAWKCGVAGRRAALRRIEQHPDRHKEQHGKRVAHRQRVGGGAQAVVGTGDDQAGDGNAPSAIDTPNKAAALCWREGAAA
jgi:hypothetical protein